jgi:hypothetical protein
VAAFERRQFDAAIQHFSSILEAPCTAHLRQVLDGSLGLALVYQELGQPQQADACLDQVMNLATLAGSAAAVAEIQSTRASRPRA